MVILLYGLSGSGKSTVAELAAEKIQDSIVLHGDDLREGLCSDLGFSSKDRTENHRRAFHVARILSLAGKTVFVAMIAPYLEHRHLGQSICNDVSYLEIYLNCPLSVCESRDVKGHYKRARAGELDNFTGIGDPFVVPSEFTNVVNTSNLRPEESTEEVLRLISSVSLLEFNT
jgi:adenylyl-sulfate kinase